MGFPKLRDNVALAFDGGGVRGIISAKAMRVIEKELNVDCLVKSDRVKVITGTSTGAIIAAAVAKDCQYQACACVYPKSLTSILSILAHHLE